MSMRRGVSNPKKPQPSNLLENETKKMEDKLLSLKQAMNKEKNQREDNMRTSGSRWKTATAEQPIKNYANKVLEKKNSTLTQQSPNTSSSSIQKPTSKPPALKIGNLTNPEAPKPVNKIPKRPTNISGSRPSSNQSSRSALNKSLTGKENENNLNSSFRRSMNQSFESPAQHQASTSMTQFTQQTGDIEEDLSEKPPSSLKNSGLDFLVQKERKPQKVIQTKLNELSQNTTQVNANSQKKQQAESNLLKHLNQQKELQKEVHQFLTSVNLLQYQQVFEDNGFDDLETILEINTEIMNSMKIPAGHQIKIQKRIDTLKLEEKQVAELHREKDMKDQQSESSKVKNIVLIPREKRTDLEELEPPAEEQDEYDSNYKMSSSSSTATTTNKTKEKGGELLQGNFNEEESHKSFLEALMEFRNQGKKEVIQNKEQEIDNQRANLSTAERKKSVRFADGVVDNEREHTIKMAKKSKNEEQEDGTIRGFGKNTYQSETELNGKEEVKETPAAKNPFFYSSGGDSWSNETFPYSVDAQMETDPKSDPSYGRKPKRDIDRISCYNCYKLVPLGQEKTFNIKNFCSNQCLSVYKGSSYITCQCGKKELKDDATFAKATWFCSEVCALDLKDKPNHKNLKIDGNNEIDNNNSNYEEDGEEEVDLDFGNNNTTSSSKVLSLEQLEQKYKKQREPSPPKKKTQKK